MNLPNSLSLLRLLMVPVFAWAFFSPSPNAHYYAAGIYALAFATDIADGYIARRFNMVTRLGRILDPLADKLMTFTVITSITAAGIIPAWVAVVFFVKELAMCLGAVSLFRRTDDVISANYLGKASTGVFFIVCAALVLFPAIPRHWATGLMTGAIILAILAFLGYLGEYLGILRAQKS